MYVPNENETENYPVKGDFIPFHIWIEQHLQLMYLIWLPYLNKQNLGLHEDCVIDYQWKLFKTLKYKRLY